MIREEIKNLDTSGKALTKFGITMGVVLALIASYLYYTGSVYFIFIGGLSALLILLGALFPPSLKSIYILWMAFSFVLGFIMTRIILFLLYYLVMTPIGLYLRATKKDLLRLRTNGNEKSYWQIKSDRKKSSADYEKQF